MAVALGNLSCSSLVPQPKDTSGRNVLCDWAETNLITGAAPAAISLGRWQSRMWSRELDAGGRAQPVETT